MNGHTILNKINNMTPEQKAYNLFERYGNKALDVSQETYWGIMLMKNIMKVLM